MDVQQLHARGRPLRAALHAQLEGEQQQQRSSIAAFALRLRPDAASLQARRALSGGDARAADSGPRAPAALGRVCECLTGRGEGIGAHCTAAVGLWAADSKQWFVWRPSAATGATLCSPSQAAQRNQHRRACTPVPVPTSVAAAKPWPAALLLAAKQMPPKPHACLDAGCHPASLAARRAVRARHFYLCIPSP